MQFEYLIFVKSAIRLLIPFKFVNSVFYACLNITNCQKNVNELGIGYIQLRKGRSYCFFFGTKLLIAYNYNTVIIICCARHISYVSKTIIFNRIKKKKSLLIVILIE